MVWLFELVFNFGGVYYSLVNLSLVKRIFDACFHFFSQCVLYKLWDVLAIDPMTISYRKEMSPSIFSQVRQDQEWILVLFVWVLWWVSCFGGEGELGHAVVEFLAGLSGLNRLILSRSSYFFRDWSSNTMVNVWFCWLWQSIFLRNLLGVRHLIWDWLSRHKLIFVLALIHFVGTDTWSISIDDFSGFRIFVLLSSLFAWDSTCRWLSPAIISLSMANLLTFISLLWSQRPHMSFFVIQRFLLIFC